MKTLFIPLLAALFILSCDSKPRSGNLEDMAPTRPQSEIDEEIIKTYVADAGLKAQRHESGIYFVIDSAGSAEKPNIGSTVTVHYRGTLLNGQQFDASYDRGEPATFSLSQVVQGWQIGIPFFGRGGKGTLIIPSGLAYGPQGRPGSIPPNSVLRFDVEVINF